MKKIAAVLVSAVLVVSFVSFAFAETVKGTVKSVDEKAGTVVVTQDDKDVTLKAEKSADLAPLKAGDKVEATVEGDVAKSIKKKKAKAAVGC